MCMGAGSPAGGGGGVKLPAGALALMSKYKQGMAPGGSSMQQAIAGAIGGRAKPSAMPLRR